MDGSYKDEGGSSNNQYFAAKDAKDTAAILLSKAQSWYIGAESNGYLEKIRMMYAAYHGAYYTDIGTGHQITFGGEQGELTNLPINHLRNLAQHIIVITTTNRPTLEARATNNDFKSHSQTILANGLLDYYMREKRLEKFLKTAVEYAVVLGAGYIKMSWNATTGEIYEYNEETNTPIYEGDVEFSNLSPFDVVFDTTKETQDQHEWFLCRTWKNKFDLMAKYPEFADKIKQVTTKNQMDRMYNFQTMMQDETDDVPVYEFYHKRTESMPDGRYLLFLPANIILIDSPLPYRNLPIYRIAPGDILGTPFGYTPLFDILPIQEGINTLYSTVLTNQNAFGVQNVLVPRGCDVTIESLSGGLNLIEANTQFGEPKAINLTQTPGEVFKFLEILESAAETISGVSSLTRGNPDPSLKSGNALALVQSMTLQFLSGLQQSYVQLMEDVGSGLINMLKDFAAVPRVAAIVGKSNRTLMKEFNGDDLSNVNRVIVDVGNPLSRTTAGRVQMAEQMMQMGIITNPKDYFTVMNTGRLDSMTQDDQMTALSIEKENERMSDGLEVKTLITDNHALHIMKHKAVLDDPDLRFDDQLSSKVLQHITEHYDFLKNGDPNLLMLTGNQPIQPPPMPGGPPNPGAGGPIPPPQGGPAGGPTIASQPPPPQIGANQRPVNMPQPAKPAGEFRNLPTNPANMPTQ